jgi:hypothetical protein
MGVASKVQHFRLENTITADSSLVAQQEQTLLPFVMNISCSSSGQIWDNARPQLPVEIKDGDLYRKQFLLDNGNKCQNYQSHSKAYDFDRKLMSRDNRVGVLVTGDPENLGIGFGTALISVSVVE